VVYGKLRDTINQLGPGILTAAAAIGGSHLVASTRAGAEFGWQLVGLVLLVNLVKYPFFLAGTRYPLATGQSLQAGYLQLGAGYLYLFSALNLIAAVVNSAGVAMLTAAILTQFIPGVSVTGLALPVLLVSALLLVLGHYNLLDRLTKLVMLVLVVATLAAVALACRYAAGGAVAESAESPWQWLHIGFLVAMMGWMPAPIEISNWTSVWLLSKQQHQKIAKQAALFDFNLGYLTTVLLALAFLALGALVMHQRGESFSAGGIAFSQQLIQIYTQVMGDWSRWLISLVALLCIFSTTLTVLDGYSRSLSEAMGLLGGGEVHSRRRHQGWIALLVVAGFMVIAQFKGALLTMLEFAMILAFLSTPVFAWLNYRLMTGKQLATEARYSSRLSWLARAGLLYLISFSLLFIYWYLVTK